MKHTQVEKYANQPCIPHYPSVVITKPEPETYVSSRNIELIHNERLKTASILVYGDLCSPIGVQSFQLVQTDRQQTDNK